MWRLALDGVYYSTALILMDMSSCLFDTLKILIPEELYTKSPDHLTFSHVTGWLLHVIHLSGKMAYLSYYTATLLSYRYIAIMYKGDAEGHSYVKSLMYWNIED
jgi:hypothetical protein